MPQSRFKFVFIVLTIFLISCGGGGTEEASTQTPQIIPVSTTLKWVAPTSRVGGDALSINQISGYKVYIGTSMDDLNLIATIADPYTEEFEITDLSNGTYYFAVSAYDEQELESTLSNIVRREL